MMGFLFFFFGGPFTTFQGLWGFPFLLDVYKCDRLQASNLLMVIALGVIVGGPPLVYLLGKYFPNGKRPQLSLCIGLQVFVWIFLALTGPSLGNWALVFLFFLMGLSLAGFFALFWSIVQEITPAHRLGTVMGYLNPAAFLGIAIFQPVTGYLMDRVGKIGGTFPFQAYQHAFFLCLVSIALSLALSLSLLRKRSFAK